MIIRTNFWDSALEALVAKFAEILNEYSCISKNPLNEDLRKDFVGLAKYLVKTRESFKSVAPEWVCCDHNGETVNVNLFEENWKLEYPNFLHDTIIPYLARHPELCEQYRSRLTEYFESGNFTPLELCIRIAKALALPPQEFEDVELANLQEILNHLKRGCCTEQESLLHFETYHGCHCD